MHVRTGKTWLAGCTALLVLSLGATAPAVADLPPIQIESRDIDGARGVDTVAETVSLYLATKSYAALDEFIQRVAASGQRSNDGRWILAAVPGGIASHHYPDSWWTGGKEAKLEQIAEWRAQVPQSTVVDLAEAIICKEWAWHIRGHGYADTVKPEASKLFRQELLGVERILQRSQETTSNNPVWYELSLEVATDLHRDEKTFRALYDAGVARFPEYQPLYSAMIRHLSPQWYGSIEAIDAYIAETVKPMPPQQGKMMYVRLYRAFVNSQPQDFPLFTASKASWPKVKAGYEEMMKEYPDSSWNLNNFASFACSAHDAETYRRLRGQIGGRIYPQAWYRDELEGCDRRLGGSG